jgi:tetratricopeptide (TPR) repeat protein
MDLLEPYLKQAPRDVKALTLLGMALSASDRRTDAARYFRQALEADPKFTPALRALAIDEMAIGRISEAKAHLEKLLGLTPADPIARMAMAQIEFTARNHEAAVTHYEKSGELYLRDPPNLLRFAQSCMESGQPEKAAQLLGSMPENADAATHFGAGVLLANLKDYAGAAREFEWARNGYSDPYNAGFNLMLAYLKSGRAPDAVRTGEELTAKGHRKAELFNVLARAYENSGNTKEAYEALRTATNVDPSDPANYLDLIALCITHRNYDLALEIADISIARLPSSDRLHLQRGIVLAMKEQFDGARTAFQAAVDRAPGEGLPYVALGLILMQMDRAPDAVTILRKRAKTAGGDYLVLWFLGEALNRSGATPESDEGREAVEALTRSVSIAPDVPQSRVLLGKLLAARGEGELARTHLTRALELDPENVAATYQLAQVLQRGGDRARAKELFAKVSKAKAEEREQFTRGGLQHIIRAAGNPDAASAESLYRRGIADEQHGRTDAAIANLEAALRIQPDLTAARYQLANCCRKRGDFEGEMRLLAKVTEQAPDLAEARFNYGLALQREQKMAEAVEQLKRAVELAPKDDRYALALGVALADRSPDEAIEVLRRAAQLAPANAEAHYNLALSLAAAGDGAGAIGEFESALRLAPNHAHARRGLGVTLVREDRIDDAIRHLRLALDISPNDAEALNNLGLAQLRLKDIRGAIVSFERAVEVNPKLIKAHFNLAQAYQRADRSEDARRASKRAAELTTEQRNLGRAMVLVQTARQRLASGDAAAALSALREAVQVSPRFADAHADLAGAILESGGDPMEAVRELRQVLNIDPERASAHYQIGRALLKAGDLKLALEELRAAADMAPCRVEIMRALARTALDAGDTATAVTQLQRVVAWEPDEVESQALLKAISAGDKGKAPRPPPPSQQ